MLGKAAAMSHDFEIVEVEWLEGADWSGERFASFNHAK
jgi:hypothetical protein